MATQYINKEGKVVDLSSFGDAGSQNIEANRLGLNIAPSALTSTAPTMNVPTPSATPTTSIIPPAPLPTEGVTKADIPTKITPDAFQADASPFVKQQRDLLAQRQEAQRKMTEALTPTPQEIEVTNQINTLNQQAREAMFNVEKIGGLGSFVGGESSRIAREATMRLQGLTDQLKTLVASREVKIDALKSEMEYSKENLDMLTNLSKLTQPDVISTGVDKATGEIYSIVKDPQTGAITQKVVGSVTPEEAKLDYIKSYTDSNGNEVASFLDPSTNKIVNKVMGKAQGAGGSTLTELQGNLDAYAQRFASDGKLPSPAELKSAGLTVGQVIDAAKSIPKPKGALVSTLTGVAPSNLSATESAGITAMNEIVNQTLPKMQELFPKLYTGVLGGIGGTIYTTQDRQDYETFKQEFLSKLLVARSGAAVTEQEYARYAKLLPGTFNQALFLGSTGEKKLESLAKSMKTNLDNTLTTKQLSIYGYTPIKLGGKEYKVGDTVEVNGIQGQILPDGSIAVQ